MKRAFGLLVLGALSLLAACAPGRQPQPLRPIVVITIDTLRADHLGCYGYFRPTSPVLDALAAESVWFANAVTTMATTLPAHVSLWTSRYPLQTGVTSNGRRLTIGGERLDRMGGDKSRVRLFAELLRELGYSTAAFVSATPVKKNTGINAGFELFDQPEVGGRKAAVTTDRVIEWLDSEPEQPFFLWVHYFDPHKPYDPPEPFRQAFETEPGLIEFLKERGVPDPTDPHIQEVNNLYDGEILSADTEIGRLLDRLRASDLYDRSTVVLTSDHGEGLGQHNWIGHGKINNEQLFVPLMIKFPKELALNGQRVERLVSLIDVIPTLTESLSLPFSDTDRSHFSGINVLARRAVRDFALAQRSTVSKKWKLEEQGQREKFALVGERWKYLFNSTQQDELFDMRQDRDELTNLIDLENGTAEKMRDKLLEEIAAYSGADDFRVVEETLPAILEELRAHGYF
jgi:arylsulfatase A-like enzyme